MKPTHIIYQIASDNAEKLFRASDGMQIAGRHHAVVVFGLDPNRAVSRVFLDDRSASAWLHGHVVQEDCHDCGLGEPLIEVVNQEALVIQPGQSMALPGSGSLRKM